MNAKQEGQWVRSERIPFSPGQSITVRPDFMVAANNGAFPEVAEMIFVFGGGQVTTLAGQTFAGQDAAKMFQNIQILDSGGEVVNAPGSVMRIIEQIELGDKQIDQPDIGPASTVLNYRYKLRFVCEPRKAQRPRDFRIPLFHFLEGGQILIASPQVPATLDPAFANTWYYRVYVRVVDGRTPELKTRRRIRREAVNSNQEFDYNVNGQLRSAFFTTELSVGYTNLGFSFPTLYSRTLETPPDFETDLLVDRYVQESDSVSATRDEIATGFAIPIITPNRHQKTGEMIDVKSVHVDLRATPLASMVFVTDAVVDRDPHLSARALGYQNPAQLGQDLIRHGRVVDSKPGGTPMVDYRPDLMKRLPLRLPRHLGGE